MRVFSVRAGTIGVTKLVLVASMLVLLAAPATTQAATTSVVAEVDNASGGAIANAAVYVFEWPGDPGPTGSATLIGQGTTGSAGTAAVTLDTSSIPAADIDADGNFNVQIVTANPSTGLMGSDFEVATVGQSTSSTSSATGAADSGTAAPASTTPTLSWQSAASCGGCSPDQIKWVRVMVWNIGNGMKSERMFSKGKATQTQVVYGTGGTVAGVAKWNIGGMWEEDTNRSSVVDDTRNGSFHYYDLAEYKMRMFKAVSCTRYGCQTQWEWQPWHWDGNYTCPDSSCGAGTVVCPCQSYTVPTFVPGNATVLPLGRIDTRLSGKTKVFSGSFTLEGLGVSSKAQYAANTQISWQRSSAPACSGTPYLWGASRGWNSADIVQASCQG
jgi:hypothetical protein